MPRKKKYEPKDKLAQSNAESNADSEPQTYLLQSIWASRLVISSEQTPSGVRYDVQPGSVIAVNPADYAYLLGLSKTQSNCCGGVPNPSPIKYFQEV